MLELKVYFKTKLLNNYTGNGAFSLYKFKNEGLSFSFKIKPNTKGASRLRVERRGDMESEKQSDSGVEHGNDLCALAHEGRFIFLDLGEISLFKCGIASLMERSGVSAGSTTRS
ncbi:hypothetical protein CW751_08100 [Brumimicrobium salinarum]|uniref:Uncharacterized protein n=1 Tax=Brumimicrobium salinarum TaxID=2058658 RepID=A0A2I0R2A7_9FLAO|nr:hypothetical protein CW751_08100 [Brumimicrobium salinarum]